MKSISRVKVTIVYFISVLNAIGCNTTAGMLGGVDLSIYDSKVRSKPSACIQLTALINYRDTSSAVNLEETRLIKRIIEDVAKEFNGFSNLTIKDSCDDNKTDLLIRLTPNITTGSVYDDLLDQQGFVSTLIWAIPTGIFGTYYLFSTLSLYTIPFPYMETYSYEIDAAVDDRRGTGVSHSYTYEEKVNSHAWLLAVPILLWQESHNEPESSIWRKMAENLYANMLNDGLFE